MKFPGWDLVMAENRKFDVIATNNGPATIWIRHAQPWRTKWRIESFTEVAPGTVARTLFNYTNDNDDNFFMAARLSNNVHVGLETTPGTSNAVIKGRNQDGIDIEWWAPQVVKLTVQATS